MRLRLIIPPTDEPVSLQEAKEYLRVTHSYEDQTIANQIRAARLNCESAARMAFITQTWEATYQLPRNKQTSYHLGGGICDPDRINKGVSLLRQPVASVAEVYLFNGGVGSIADTASYSLNDGFLDWSIQFRETLIANNTNVRIRYVAGRSKEAFIAACPDILEAIKITVSEMYENRGTTDQVVPPSAMALLMAYWTSPTYRA